MLSLFSVEYISRCFSKQNVEINERQNSVIFLRTHTFLNEDKNTSTLQMKRVEFPISILCFPLTEPILLCAV